ncbi:MAG TPA: hypothetical protein VGO80_20005 [Solirubrobacteraceae bacterium]|jgi:hypothetical protein|nr:hypothetical protein [Solirubrobacteraceae bacterium]
MAQTAKIAVFITGPVAYASFVQVMLTPIVYLDHVYAYRSCCCAGPRQPIPRGSA